MQSTYLKESLEKLSTLKARSEQIQSEENRAVIKERNKGGISDFVYPSMCGELSGIIMAASWDVASAMRVAERLEVIEREHERFVSIFEALDIDLDEESLVALETLATDQEFRSGRRELAGVINKAIRETQSDVRDTEHDNATDGLLKAGFEYDEEEDAFRRNHELVRIELTDGRACRYKWEYDTSDPNGIVASGMSGGFWRLMALVSSQAMPEGVAPQAKQETRS